MSTQKQKTSTRYCIFCRYWGGDKATRSNQPKYWEYSHHSDDCIKKRQRVNANHTCRDFELDTSEYFD